MWLNISTLVGVAKWEVGAAKRVTTSNKTNRLNFTVLKSWKFEVTFVYCLVTYKTLFK